jgi:hypothetical protein
MGFKPMNAARDAHAPECFSAGDSVLNSAASAGKPIRGLDPLTHDPVNFVFEIEHLREEAYQPEELRQAWSVCY